MAKRGTLARRHQPHCLRWHNTKVEDCDCKDKPLERTTFLEIEESAVRQIGRKVHGLNMTRDQVVELVKSLKDEIEFRTI